MMLVLKKHLELEMILFILLGAAVGFSLLLYREHTSALTLASNNIPAPAFPAIEVLPTAIPPTPTQMPTPTITPTPTPAPIAPFIPTVANTSQSSPDGKKTLTLRTIQNKDGTTTYDITTSDSSTFMYSQTLPSNENINIPFNTWSPNDAYFFIQEYTGTSTNVMVFNDNGAPFANGDAYLDLTGDFAKYAPNADFDQASGWASDNLIVILTKNQDGSEGTSYWYEIPDESVIPLATKF
jgi:hypothetical protein